MHVFCFELDAFLIVWWGNVASRFSSPPEMFERKNTLRKPIPNTAHLCESHFLGVSLLLRRRFEAGFQHAVAKKSTNWTHHLHFQCLGSLGSALKSLMIVNFWFIRHLYVSCVASTGSLFVEPCIVLAATSTHSLGCPDGPQSSNRSSSSLEQVSVLSLQQYICIRYAYNTPPHATPTFVQRAKRCPGFSGGRHKLLCCFPTNSQCPNIP